MRQSASIAILLVLISLLMVAVAAILFLGQGRQRWLAAEQQLRADLAAESTRAVENDNLLATRESENQQLAQGLQSSQLEMASAQETSDASVQQVATLEGELAELSAQLETSDEEPPLLRFIAPEDDALYQVGETVTLIVAASDRRGIVALNISYESETLSSVSPNDEPLVVLTAQWTPQEVGVATFTASAINVNGSASPLATASVTVVEAIEDRDPLAAERDIIESNVIAIRGLTPITPVVPVLLSRVEMGERVESDFLSEFSPQDASDDARVLSAFDFLPPGFDLATFYNELLSEQIAGFYDPETDEFVVVSDDDELSPAEKLTHAHEFVHALQDQHFDLDMMTSDELSGDEALAMRALAEGDASLTEVEYLFAGHLSLADLSELMEEIGEIETVVLDGGPTALVNSFTFPYEQGLAFAQALHDQGGYELVNDAWETPPRSTEQILHPDRYLAGDMPQLVNLPPLTDTLGTGWRQLDEDVFGEFFLREYLSQQLDAATVDQAATGWGGDRYAVYENATIDQYVMVFSLAWDSTADADEFMEAYAGYAESLFNTPVTEVEEAQCWLSSEAICLYRQGDQTVVMRATTLVLIDSVDEVVLGGD